MRCPKCDALAADSDPCCLWCGKRLNHSARAPQVPIAEPYSEGRRRAAGPRFDQVGMAVGMAGVFTGMIVATGPDPDVVKPLIAVGICLGVPVFCVWLVWLLRRSR